ncbi:hypothetical protein [Curvibacter phage PCA1]|nr:hypothetical protein [Curvibacter phage PCA1]
MKDCVLDDVKVGDELLCTSMGGGLRRIEVTAVHEQHIESGQREYRRSDGRVLIGDDTGQNRCFIPTEAQWRKFRIDNLAANLRTFEIDELNFTLVENMLNANAEMRGFNYMFTDHGLRFIKREPKVGQVSTNWQPPKV